MTPEWTLDTSCRKVTLGAAGTSAAAQWSWWNFDDDDDHGHDGAFVAEYQQGEVARVVMVRGLAEWLVGMGSGCKEELPWGEAREGEWNFNPWNETIGQVITA